MLVRWLCFVLIALLSTPALAATAWIDDEIYVPVRSGAGSGYRIVHRGLKSGTRVEFLGEDGDWAHIRFSDNEGYIPKQYISRSPTAAIRLEQISGDSKEMESRMTEMRERLSSVETERDRLSAENEELKGSLSSRSDELENLRGNNTSQQWITGVGILILGAIAGLLLKSKSGRRRSTWAN